MLNSVNLYQTAEHYRDHRLRLGVAEGVEEILPGNSFPLEYNLDYLNGGLYYYCQLHF